MNRAEALTVTCPKCGAPPRMPCMGKKRARKSCHVERHKDVWGGRKAPSLGVREQRCNKRGYVYLIADNASSVKIGFSENYPSSRLRNLQTANPNDLRLIAFVTGTRRDEQRYHEMFAHLRIRGEWFKADPEILEYFGEMVT